MDVVQTLRRSACRELFPCDSCLGDRRRSASRRGSYEWRKDIRRSCVENVDSNLLRRINKTKNYQRRAEVLVQLADETVAATGFAGDR